MIRFLLSQFLLDLEHNCVGILLNRGMVSIMENQLKCRCGSAEHSHLCLLRSNGMHAEIDAVTADPKFYCFICGGEADCAENLCEPAKIE